MSSLNSCTDIIAIIKNSILICSRNQHHHSQYIIGRAAPTSRRLDPTQRYTYDRTYSGASMLISQYQAYILKSRIADRLDEWWVLSQDRDRNSSTFTSDRHGKDFKVSLSVNESILTDKHRSKDKRT
jgi:hypothetical protein